MEEINEILPLAPVHFFSFSFDLLKTKEKKEMPLGSKYLLTDLSSRFFDESPFASLYLGWSEKGIHITFKSHIAFSNPQFPQYRNGDSLELFFDTRDVKSGGVTKFCHHFCILGQEIETEEEKMSALELTRFRGEDAHDLADQGLIDVKREKKLRGCEMVIFLPREILHGYDPTQFDRLGFTYRINRAHGLPQYFSVSGEEVMIENHPSLWATFKMVDEK